MQSLKEFATNYPNATMHDGAAKVWDARDGRARGERCVMTLAHAWSVTSVCVAPDGVGVMTGSIDNRARSWDLRTGACARTFSGHDDEVTCVGVTPSKPSPPLRAQVFPLRHVRRRPPRDARRPRRGRLQSRPSRREPASARW